MKILIVSDEESSFIWDHFDPSKFNDINLILSCGDLKPDYLSFLATMIYSPLYYVHGNHDSIYKTYIPEGCESIDGKFIIYKGIRILGLGGSYKYNNKIHQYTENQMKLRIQKLKFKIMLNKGIDIIVAHAPPFNLGDAKDLCHIGFKCFVDLIDKYSPKYFFHGHQHLNYTGAKRIQEYKNTKIINAYNYHILEY